MKKYKFITIKQIDGELFNNKPMYTIYNNRTGATLGYISWYKPWKEYVFSSREDCAFNNTCLNDVVDFMNNVVPTLK